MSNSSTNINLPPRDLGIDALRGLAIVAMVASHLARDILVDPHPIWLRAFGSLAAPLFILLAGFMVAQTGASKRHPLTYYVERGLIILGLAAAVDVLLWGMYPFVGFDVLYLIGAAVPLAALFGRLQAPWQSLVLVSILGITVVARGSLGYPDHVLAVMLYESPMELWTERATLLQQWLVAGWFPLLPWLFFAMLGVRLFQWRQADARRFAAQVACVGVGLLLLGVAVGVGNPPASYVRGGYSELFYPATTVFVLIASGAALLLFALVGNSWLRNCQPLVLLGQCALLMYIAHLVVIHWVLLPLLDEVELPLFALVYGGLLLLLLGLAEAVAIYKQRSHRRLPMPVRFLLGS